MKPTTLDRARAVDERYFGDIGIDRGVGVFASQTQSMVRDNSEVNVRRQTGDLLFAVISMCRNRGWDIDTVLTEATDKIEQRRKNRHYYEAHVTIEPVFEERLELFKKCCAEYKFRAANLLMQKRKEETAERSANDAFCTGRGVSYTDIQDRMMNLVASLKNAGFKVWRYKIESTLLDSRYDDKKFPLDRETLPEKERNPHAPADGALEGRDE